MLFSYVAFCLFVCFLGGGGGGGGEGKRLGKLIVLPIRGNDVMYEVSLPTLG